MRVSDTVKMAATKAGKNMRWLDQNWYPETNSRNAIYNKSMRDSWSARDLMKVARMTGCRLAFVFPDGQQILFDTDAEGGD